MHPTIDINVKDEVAALNLGKKIKELRTLREFTLQRVSDLTGLSKPLLSQIENNLAAPPIATLIKISTALGVKISYFFQDDSEEHRIVIVKKNERYGVEKVSQHDPPSQIGYRYKSLAYPMVDKHMEPFIAEIETRNEDALIYNTHKGEEFIFLLKGNLELRTNTQSYIIEPGDSIYFDSSIPHALRGVGGIAKALVTIFTPRA